MQPLQATRVLDLTRLLPGAVCTTLLRDLGAEVIKVEDPHRGDYARFLPPLVDGMGAFFRASNRGKKSIVLDLKADAGQAALHRLARTADVLIEGFRPGVAQRLGADYAALRAVNPRLVCCSLSGWGQSGPEARRSGHDLNYIAGNGLLGAELQPTTPASQVADVAGAFAALSGILAALLQRERTGRGDYLDVALAEAALPFAMTAWVEAMSPGAEDEFISLRGESACYRVYQARDGESVALGAIEPKFWANFCRAVGQPDWIARQTNRQRQPALIAAVAALFASKPADAWATLLDEADCCFSRVIAPGELLNEAQIQARGLAGVDGRGVPWLRSPIRLGQTASQQADAPAWGEHTSQLLGEIGYGESELEALLAAGVIRQAP